MKKLLVIFFSCFCLLASCANPNIKNQIISQVDSSYELETEITVSAKKGWENSAITLREGQKVIIRANGLWNKGFAPDCGPDGYIGSAGEIRYNSQYGAMALLGKIGNGKEFLIGNYLSMEADTSGELSFRPNCADIGFWDNSGGVVVSIFLPKIYDAKEPPPPPKFTQTTQQHSQNAKSGSFASTEAGTSWAIVIGISIYQYAGQNGLTNLIFADDDAKAFARSLRNLGWSESHIKLITNEEATQRNIMIALESWLSKAGPNDQIILFWAGHGFPDPEDPEKVYFAGYDTDISIPATGYRMDRVRVALEERKSKNVILFADTCHAGKLITRGARAISIVPKIDKMKRENKIPKGWIFMVGADTDRQAIEHTSWSNGAFTYSLINGLSGKADGFQSAGAKDGIVTMGELKEYMNTAMPDETQKVLGVAKRPIITTSTGDPDIWDLTLQPTK
ncbi:MAG: caspase family protein [Desulfobacterales bacterium]|nr:caspase family protein [Desulfobacterales bacterium]